MTTKNCIKDADKMQTKYKETLMHASPHYSTDTDTTTLQSIQKAVTPDVFGCDGLTVRKVPASEHSAHVLHGIHAVSITWMLNVFIITYDVPVVK